ncbi:MAG TPA: HEAT repeat domain-containing protein, partial [Pirellulales bacterium]
MMPSKAESSAKTKAGLSITFDTLLKSRNEAATELLLDALSAATDEIQDAALEALLKRRTIAGHRQLLLRLPMLAPRQRAIVAANHHRLGRVVRDAILSRDDAEFARGSEVAAEFRDYETLPTLLQVAEDGSNAHRESAAGYILQLAEALYQELAAPRAIVVQRDPQLMRTHVLHSLEHSVVRYSQHRRTEIVEAFLLLSPRENPLLVRILGNPMDAAYLPVIDMLTHSTRGGIVRLVLSYLDDPCAPSSILTVMSRRSDPKFLENFLHRLGSQASAVVNQNLKRINALSWMENQVKLVDSFDVIAQQGAVHLARTSSIQRGVAYNLIEHLMRRGKTEGRQAAAAALASFHGADANRLVCDCLRDPDPVVQSHLIGQLRSRGTPGALQTLLSMLDHPHEVVRAAARRNLEEFSFDRYLTAFEMLDERVRRDTGPVVRKVDPTAPKRLAEELDARSRTRRMRGV